MMMAGTPPILTTALVSIIMVVADVDFHGDGVDNYDVIDVVELCQLTPDVKSGVSNCSFYVN